MVWNSSAKILWSNWTCSQAVRFGNSVLQFHINGDIYLLHWYFILWEKFSSCFHKLLVLSYTIEWRFCLDRYQLISYYILSDLIRSDHYYLSRHCKNNKHIISRILLELGLHENRSTRSLSHFNWQLLGTTNMAWSLGSCSNWITLHGYKSNNLQAVGLAFYRLPGDQQEKILNQCSWHLWFGALTINKEKHNGYVNIGQHLSCNVGFVCPTKKFCVCRMSSINIIFLWCNVTQIHVLQFWFGLSVDVPGRVDLLDYHSKFGLMWEDQ